MRRNLRRGLTLGVIVLTALLGAGAALASDDDDEQVVDISKQLMDMDKKMAELQQKGRTARRRIQGRSGLRLRRTVAGLRVLG